MQRREKIVGGEASEDLESSIQSARGGGQSLDSNLQAKMGQAMGADFSRVKVHTDARSDQRDRMYFFDKVSTIQEAEEGRN
jgi:hypothetical protein